MSTDNMTSQEEVNQWSNYDVEEGNLNELALDEAGQADEFPLMAPTPSQPIGEERRESQGNYDDAQSDTLYLYDEGSDRGGSSDASSNASSDMETEDPLGESGDRSSTTGADLSTVPISKDGMAICETCGTVGVKHAFYSKSKCFCSLSCSKRYMSVQKEGKSLPKPVPKIKFPVMSKKMKKENVNPALSYRKNKRDLSNSFDWKVYLEMKELTAAPVSSFRHAPLADSWDNILVGMKVEVENHDYDAHNNPFPTAYWIASVVKIAGYKACLRYEGFAQDSSKDFWINLCTKQVFPVGWCAAQGKPLIPPKTIQHKNTDWKDFLVKRLTGSRTLPSDFYDKVQESLISRFRPGITLEVVDKKRINTTRVASVDEVVGGRMHVHYVGSTSDDPGFWCHERSPLVHPVGWSQMVGHTLLATPEYAKRSLQKAVLKKFEDNDAAWDLFLPVPQSKPDSKYKEGMKLEAIDPLNLSTICVATVTKVMRSNYLMIGIDGYTTEKGLDCFCYHATSTHVFPAGFCGLNNIKLTPPRGHKGEFRWSDYLKVTKSEAVPVPFFNQEPLNHGFEVGMRLEAVDLMEPRLICVGTVVNVIGRLLKIHFDGWEDSFDQWCDCESPDLYPVGWCELVGYNLESPRNLVVSHLEVKKRGRPQTYKGQRKKKRGRVSMMGAKSKLSDSSGNSSWNRSSEQLTIQKNHLNLTDSGVLTEENGRKEVKDDNTVVQPPHFSAPICNGTSAAAASGANAEEIEGWKKIGGMLSPDGVFLPRVGAWSAIEPGQKITPNEWTSSDVANFLKVNDNAAYSESFLSQGVTGSQLMSLNREEMVGLTGMKVGPSLKIYSLIQQVKSKTC